MNLNLDTSIVPAHFKSPSRISGVITEHWAAQNLYCCACSNDVLSANPTNTKATDFFCSNCRATYQLKSRAHRIGSKVLDAGYDAMIAAITSDNTPNLLVMHYSRRDWSVQNLLLIPRFFFSAAAVEKRKPLGPTADRAGYVGCNILLSQIAPDGKLRMVQDGVAATAAQVRSEYEKVRPLEKLPVELRGWALDVFACVRRIGKIEFQLDEVYRFENELAALHPSNQNVRPKIRQQLQELRDAELLEFLGHGSYRLRV